MLFFEIQENFSKIYFPVDKLRKLCLNRLSLQYIKTVMENPSCIERFRESVIGANRCG